MKDSFRCRSTMEVDGKTYHYFDLGKAKAAGLSKLDKLPYSMKVLLENLLRNEDGTAVTKEDCQAVSDWVDTRKSDQEIAYHPARVLMQDFTGVPAVVDLAAMREAVEKLGGDPTKINPLSPVDLVIDHSVSVDAFGTAKSFQENVDIEFDRNGERYAFLRWAQTAFQDFSVVPPGTGICHQVNLEYLAKVVFTRKNGNDTWAYPDTLVGTDSHTTMVNGLSVLGWGVGGIEAEAAMLSQPVTMVLPEVVGFKLHGKVKDGVTATDVVLTVTQKLRAKGVVGKFVEFFGPGLDELELADRATIANMAPEYGATCGFFPIDAETIAYLKLSARDPHQVKLVEEYAKKQGLWRNDAIEPVFTDVLDLDLGTVVPSLAGPKRPQDRVELSKVAAAFTGGLQSGYQVDNAGAKGKVDGADFELKHGSVVIAAITSCTNTSNPNVMIAAGLVARKARALGLTRKPWVKTSLAPGSQVVSSYLEKSGLQTDLDALGFNLVGYGCTTCIGNSGPLADNISAAIAKNKLVACSVLSGNRNFEGRVSPDAKANYLASPPLCVVYAIAGDITIDVTKDPIGTGKDGKPVYLKDVWPTTAEIKQVVRSTLTPDVFKSRYSDVFKGPEKWQSIQTAKGFTFKWDNTSTYVKNPPYFEGMKKTPEATKDIVGARPLAILGDSITTDHISPAGSIKEDSPAGKYLVGKGIKKSMFNSLGARRGNHEVMMRGTFANIRIKNEMTAGVEGGVTKHQPSGDLLSIYDAAMRYREQNVPLIVVAGKEYGTGSSRDWAAKGPALLGIKAVVVESFERIHRSNLIGMGILPLQFKAGETRASLKLDGSETFDVTGVPSLKPRGQLTLTIHRKDGTKTKTDVTCRIDTEDELRYFQNGGILNYVIRRLL